MIIPVRLGDDVPTRFINFLWLETENRPVTEVVERIVAALEIIPNYNASFSNQPTPPLPHEEPEAPPHLPELDVETETLYMQARSAFTLEDWETAIAFFQQVVYRDPNYDYGAAKADLEIARQRLIPVRIDRWDYRADAAARAGRWVEEIYYWNLILNLDVNHVYAPDANERLQVAEQNQRAESKYQRAKNFLAQYNLPAAKSEIKRLLADAPHYGDPDGVCEQSGIQTPLNYLDYLVQRAHKQQELEILDAEIQNVQQKIAQLKNKSFAFKAALAGTNCTHTTLMIFLFWIPLICFIALLLLLGGGIVIAIISPGTAGPVVVGSILAGILLVGCGGICIVPYVVSLIYVMGGTTDESVLDYRENEWRARTIGLRVQLKALLQERERIKRTDF